MFENLSDEELCALALSSDEAKECLVKRYSNAVLSIARRCCMSAMETEDLVQEGMCALFAAISSYTRVKGDFKPYANTCIRNKILDYVRQTKSKKNMPLANYLPLDSIEETYSPLNIEDKIILDEDNGEFYEKIESVLSPFEFKTMKLYLDGMKIAEISNLLGKEKKSIENAISRSYKKLIKIYR